jgi:hypothetical protein
MLNNFSVKTAYTFSSHDHMSVFSLLENMMSRLGAFGIGSTTLLEFCGAPRRRVREGSLRCRRTHRLQEGEGFVRLVIGHKQMIVVIARDGVDANAGLCKPRGNCCQEAYRFE